MPYAQHNALNAMRLQEPQLVEDERLPIQFQQRLGHLFRDGSQARRKAPGKYGDW
jgi:hypothetical protein